MKVQINYLGLFPKPGTQGCGICLPYPTERHSAPVANVIPFQLTFSTLVWFLGLWYCFFISQISIIESSWFEQTSMYGIPTRVSEKEKGQGGFK